MQSPSGILKIETYLQLELLLIHKSALVCQDFVWVQTAGIGLPSYSGCITCPENGNPSKTRLAKYCLDGETGSAPDCHVSDLVLQPHQLE